MSGDASESERPLTPAARAKVGARGTPVEIAGASWLLADFIPYLDAVWDRVYDQNYLATHYDTADLRKAGFRLLLRNYDLTPDEPDEGVRLIACVPLDELAHAVEIALFGGNENYHGYSEYVRVTLWANAIDPALLPPEMVRPVMEYLVRVGRAVPPSAFISSVEAASVRQSFTAFLRPRPKAEPEPGPEPLSAIVPTSEPDPIPERE